MPLIIWDSNFSVGHPDMDRQHQRIMTKVNLLNDVVETCAEPEAITAALSCVTGYANEHFTAEERLMAELGYPGFGSHRNVHREYRRKIIKLTHDTRHVDPEAPAALARYLGTWWLKHILDEDMGYRGLILSPDGGSCNV